MLLVLRILSYHNASVEPQTPTQFSENGGTIGRSPGNDLVLDDPSKYISRSHARIIFRDGQFYLADVGSNPSIINDRPLGNGREVLLNAGDRIMIGDYLIEAQIQSPPHFLPLESPVNAPPAHLPSPTFFEQDRPKPVAPIVSQDPLVSASILRNDASSKSFGYGADPFGMNLSGAHSRELGNGLQSGAEGPFGREFRGSGSDHAAPEKQAFPERPPIATPVLPIPDDYDLLSGHPPKAPHSPVATRPPVSASSLPPSATAASVSHGPTSLPGADPTREALLRGLGLRDLQTKHTGPELAELVGAMLREATSGAMQTLMARSLTKRESRIEVTIIGSRGNNPLKFFPNADSALNQMLSQTGGGYMEPVKAVENAFADLQAHEMAVMAGMRAALGAVLRRFDPQAIEQRLAVPTVIDKMLVSNRKAKMWDRLVELYAEMLQEADDDFQRLFGESFAKAYEEQVKRMHTRGK